MVGEVVCVPGITENVIAPSYGHHNRFPFATKKERLTVGVAAACVPCHRNIYHIGWCQWECHSDVKMYMAVRAISIHTLQLFPCTIGFLLKHKRMSHSGLHCADATVPCSVEIFVNVIVQTHCVRRSPQLFCTKLGVSDHVYVEYQQRSCAMAADCLHWRSPRIVRASCMSNLWMVTRFA